MFATSRLRALQGLLILAAAGSLLACHKDAPQKPKPVLVKKSPAELKQLATSAKQSLEELKQPLSGLDTQFTALHQKFDALPADLPEFGETRAKFNAADEGLGRMNAKVPWLSAQIDAAVKSEDGAELEELSKSIARSQAEIPQVQQIAMELLHEVMPFARLAERIEAGKKASCEAVKVDRDAVSKKLSAH